MKLNLRRELIYNWRRFITNIPKNNSVSTVKLAYSVCEPTETQQSSKKTPIVVLHGLLDSRRNWNSLSKLISGRTNRKVISPDLRNHGESPNTSELSYRLMGEDMNRLLNDLGIDRAVLIGHSAGSRVLMYLALTRPELVEKLICIDFAPIRTSVRLRSMLVIAKAMKNIQFDKTDSLSEAQALAHSKLSVIVPSEANCRFLIENIIESSESGKCRWCLNISALVNNFEVLCSFDGVSDEAKFYGPTLFVYGTQSDSIIDEDHEKIKELFPAAKMKSMDAGHLLHQQKPREFVDIIVPFIDNFSSNVSHKSIPKPYVNPFGKLILAAAVEAGYTISEDFNGDDVAGFSVLQTTTKDGVRRSAARAYLWPVRNRSNLDISLKSTATKVIIKNGAAVGVRYYKNGEFRTVRVHKEVIVSAGTIESAKLLLLSGIGPKEHLESVGIKVVHDLPGVGENFQDHTTLFLQLTVNDTNTYDYDMGAAMEYLVFQTGPLAGVGVHAIVGQVSTNLTTPDFPDISLEFSAYTGTCAPSEIGALRTFERRNTQLLVTNVQPKSRGRVTLASNDPFDYPVIWGNYLGDSTDVDRMIQGIKLGLALAETKVMRAHDMTMSDATIEACSGYTHGSTEYWTCALRQNAGSFNHHVGTCKMGPTSDSMAVVDSKLRVHGLKGLRVADASIMPLVTSGNTAAPTMMIGERAADFIKHNWRRKPSDAIRDSKKHHTTDDLSTDPHIAALYLGSSSSVDESHHRIHSKCF